MSMTLTNAKIAIARVAGAQNDANKLALAADAIAAVAEKWSKMNWDYLKKDNAYTYTLAGTVSGGTTVTVSDTAGLNVGQGISGGGLAAGATIQSITSKTVFILSSAATTGAQTFTLAAYIPVQVGTEYVYLPSDFADFYSARLLTNKRYLEILRDREADRKVTDQESMQATVAIGPASPGSGSGFTAADQRPRARLYFKSDTAENLLLKYYRQIVATADPIDVPDDLLMTFIDDCKVWFMAQLNAGDPRLDVLSSLANRARNDAFAADQEQPDEDIRIKSSMEVYGDKYTTRGYPLDFWGGNG